MEDRGDEAAWTVQDPAEHEDGKGRPLDKENSLWEHVVIRTRLVLYLYQRLTTLTRGAAIWGIRLLKELAY